MDLVTMGWIGVEPMTSLGHIGLEKLKIEDIKTKYYCEFCNTLMR